MTKKRKCMTIDCESDVSRISIDIEFKMLDLKFERIDLASLCNDARSIAYEKYKDIEQLCILMNISNHRHINK